MQRLGLFAATAVSPCRCDLTLEVFRAIMSDVERKLSNIIVAQLAVDSASVTPATKLEDIGPEPFEMAQLIISVEDAFGIDIPDDGFDKLLTVGDLIAYVKGSIG